MDNKQQAQQQLLDFIAAHTEEDGGSLDTLKAAEKLNWDHEKAVGITKSLEQMGKITTQMASQTYWHLTDEGKQCAKEGSPEYLLMKEISAQGSVAADQIRQEGATKPWKSLGLNVLLKNKWAVATGGTVSISDNAPKEDTVGRLLVRIAEITPVGQEQAILSATGLAVTDLTALSKRKLIVKSLQNYFIIRRSDDFSTVIKRFETDLTKELMMSGAWKTADFKPYNFKAAGIPPRSGSTHPLCNTMNMFRNVLIQMGFEEMPTRRWVESCFWNFDALFQPQTHPVRDAHDTFFMKHPANNTLEANKETGSLMTPEYFYRVKSMHERGDDQSLGWQCEWSEDEALKLIMRTHTTAVSAQMLRRLGKAYEETGRFESHRFFSIDRVFRNETLDATHLAEFHQVEGVIAERGASLAQLMGVIEAFFAKIGILKIKFKPAYNPYTEPSMEVFGFHPVLQCWTEIGNSGVFRPEMLKPMGLPDDVNVLGFGLSLERPTMISKRVKDIRELFGPRAKLSVF